MDNVDFAEEFISDMKKYKEEFSWWMMYDEQYYYDTDELEQLIKAYRKARPYYNDSSNYKVSF
jgi:hypothetical protein